MKIRNKTGYSTRDLSKIFRACEKHEGTKHKYRIVDVVYSKSGYVSGRATVGDSISNGRWIKMRIPKPERAGNNLVRSVARVYIHELMHNYGQRHSEMQDVYCMDVSFIDGFKLDFAPVEKKKKQRPTNEDKLAKVEKLLDKWTKQQKKCATYIKKYKKKVRYYERRIKQAASNLKEQ